MPAGRKPKPTKLKELAGNPGKRPLNKSEPNFSGMPIVPKHLDAEAKKEWKRVVTDLSSTGVLTSMDRSSLAAYCAAWSRWMKAEQEIQKTGLVVTSPKSGYPMQNPYVGIANAAMAQMLKFASEFGMTPSSRSRITVTEAPDQVDPFAAFMDGIGANDIDHESETLQHDSD